MEKRLNAQSAQIESKVDRLIAMMQSLICLQKSFQCDDWACENTTSVVKKFSGDGEGDCGSQSENLISFQKLHFIHPPLYTEQILPAPFGRKSFPFEILNKKRNFTSLTAAAGKVNLCMQLHSMERRLDEIADMVGAKPRNAIEDKLEESKRLKEKLKSALELEKLQLRIFEQKETWMDYIFGICKPDGRVGKMGSKWVSSSWLIQNDIALTCGVGEYHHLQPNPPAITLYAR